MTTSYGTLTFPTSPKPRKARMRAVTKVGTGESTFTFSTQKQVHAGQRWECDLEFAPMTDTEARTVLAFMLKLNGKQGTVYVPEPDRTSPNGAATGTPLVDGASQTGNEVVIDGWTTSTTSILAAGDVIQIGDYMYTVLEDTNSGAGGTATVAIWPNLRSSPANNAAVTTSNCKTKMRLATNSMEWSTDQFKHYGLTLVFVEDLPSS